MREAKSEIKARKNDYVPQVFGLFASSSRQSQDAEVKKWVCLRSGEKRNGVGIKKERKIKRGK